MNLEQGNDLTLEQAVVEQLLREMIPETLLEAVVTRLAKERCVRALKAIRAVLDDDTLEDPECFGRIEAIVQIYEEMGSNGGSRHDFG